ncbi:Oidioi.mRNA.OKI2018_I69.chr1.g2696.t1.cds [Oikopleura dioica]|uniref:Oidioi.mRNA.OKI2018_I69.chr1.g2696.t1.cds n=1 Tax=Oikopleura dioica TaxID=34765 RepID=A0ABN7SVS2_OIKDI|nr:Oidioi.mRNA.OKI2018_I69.chr1.g2696.t1.cds [Oikopleura dioica]
MFEVYVIRHGQSEANKAKIHQGNGYDTDLTEEGRLQAATLKTALPSNPTKIIASPLKRAHQTCQIATGDDAQILDKRLMERSLGELEGLSQQRVKEIVVEMDLLNRFEHPACEKSEVFRARVIEAWDEILSKASAGDKIFIFCHGGVMKAIANYLGERGASYDYITIPKDRRNCCIDYYKVAEDRSVRIEYVNNHEHIPEELVTG